MNQTILTQPNQNQVSQALEPTWGIALKIWWWITWRSLLSSLVGGFLVGLVFGFFVALVKMDTATTQLFSMPIGGLVGITINVYFIKKVIGKKFRGFRLMLVKTEDSK